MSNDENAKGSSVQSGVFSIKFEDDFEGMPGVTQLLKPKNMKGNPASHLPGSPVEKSEMSAAKAPVSLAVNSLADLGVQFELHFQMDRGSYRYARMKGHGKSSLSLWQEKFYFQMKLDLHELGMTKKYQEFEKGRHLFHEDAFALTHSSKFILIVLFEENNSQKCIVLISEKTLETSEKEVREMLMSSLKQASGGDHMKIELAS